MGTSQRGPLLWLPHLGGLLQYDRSTDSPFTRWVLAQPSQRQDHASAGGPLDEHFLKRFSPPPSSLQKRPVPLLWKLVRGDGVVGGEVLLLERCGSAEVVSPLLSSCPIPTFFCG